MAAPIPAPTNPSSEIGVSRTRPAPYFSHRPAVTLYEPSNLPISSPMRKTSRSRSSSSSSARRSASR